MKKSVRVSDDGSINIPGELAEGVFGRATEVVVSVRTGCIVLSSVYVDMDSGDIPMLLEAFHDWESLDTILEKHFERASTESVQFEGDLSVLGLSDVFLFLSASKKTGCLMLENGKRWGFFFLNGNLVYAASDDFREGLAAYFLRRHFITEQDLAQGLSLIESNPSPADVLRGVSGLSEEDFYGQWTHCVEGNIYKVFTFTDGKYRFISGSVLEPFLLKLPTTTTNYVMEATRRVDEWARLKGRVPEPEAVLEVVEDVTASTRLTMEEEEILLNVNGTRNLQEVLARAKVDEMEGKKAVASLLAAGLIKVTKSGVEETPEAPRERETTAFLDEEERQTVLELVERYNGVFSTIYQALSMEVGHKVEIILGAFFKGLEPGVSILSGLNFNAEGMLPADRLVDRLSNVERDRKEKLVMDLNELLYFQLFAVKNSLGPEMEAGIVEMAKSLLKG